MGFVFIGDIINPVDFNSFEVIPGFFIKKANTAQIEVIKSQIPDRNDYIKFCDRYEIKVTHEDKTRFSRLDRIEDWNYWVIEKPDGIQVDSDFSVALSLIDAELNILFDFINPGVVSHFTILYNYISDNLIDLKQKI